MARDTQYTLYKTARTDPTFKNIWAFESEAQREAWLNTCSPQPFLNNNSISKIEIVDENKNTVFKTTEYSNITTAVKSGNTSGTPGMYSLSLRFMNNL